MEKNISLNQNFINGKFVCYYCGGHLTYVRSKDEFFCDNCHEQIDLSMYGPHENEDDFFDEIYGPDDAQYLDWMSEHIE